MNKKILVITNGNYFSKLILERLICDFPSCVIKIIIITGDYKARSGFNALWNVGKGTTFPYLLFKLFQMAFFMVAEVIHSSMALSVKRLAETYSIDIKFSQDVNNKFVHNFCTQYEPDLLVSVSCPQLIRDEILRTSRNPRINIHASLLPTYAGLAPYYWVLSNGEEFTGITVHYLSNEFDKGTILKQKKVKVHSGESAFSLFKRLCELGQSILPDAVEMALDGDPGHKQDLTKYSYFSHPTLSSYISLRNNGHRLHRLKEYLAILRDEKRHNPPPRSNLRET